MALKNDVENTDWLIAHSLFLSLCWSLRLLFAFGLFAAKLEVLSLCIDDLAASRINNIVQYYVEEKAMGRGRGERREEAAAKKEEAHKLNV